MVIPDGYVIVPKKWGEMLFSLFGWEAIEEPTISEAALFCGVGKDKIKKDLRKVNCPLRKSSEGKAGRGNEMRFLKKSVEHYKNWLKQ